MSTFRKLWFQALRFRVLNYIRRKVLRIGSFLTGKLGFQVVLSAKVRYADGRVEDRGVICRRCVTDAFVEFLVDKLVAAGNINLFKYHDCGTGVADEDKTDTALGTPWGGARVEGTQLEGATANIYKSVATISFTGPYAITEHMIFSAATGGIGMDRSKFSPINVDTNVEIVYTYELTVNSGG